MQDRRQVYALFWATDESDPEGIVEGWLDRNAFKGAESWQGNLRFVVYTLPAQLACRKLGRRPPSGRTSPSTRCASRKRPNRLRRAKPPRCRCTGITALACVLQSQRTVAQREQPGHRPARRAARGRLCPTDGWQAGEIVVDNHGLPIPAGAPPGDYRLIVALYDAETGVRLPIQEADHLALGAVNVVRPQRAIPVEVVPMQRRAGKRLGPVTLAGYAAHAKDHSHALETPLKPGDLAHVTLYWQAPDPLPPNWPEDLTFSLHLGNFAVEAPLAGRGYPTGLWQAGELVRAEFDIPFDGADAVPVVRVNGDAYRLAPLPTE